MIASVSLPARIARMTSSCPSRRARKPKVWRRVRRRVENWTVSVMDFLPGGGKGAQGSSARGVPQYQARDQARDRGETFRGPAAYKKGVCRGGPAWPPWVGGIDDRKNRKSRAATLGRPYNMHEIRDFCVFPVDGGRGRTYT